MSTMRIIDNLGTVLLWLIAIVSVAIAVVVLSPSDKPEIEEEQETTYWEDGENKIYVNKDGQLGETGVWNRRPVDGFEPSTDPAMDIGTTSMGFTTEHLRDIYLVDDDGTQVVVSHKDGRWFMERKQ